MDEAERDEDWSDTTLYEVTPGFALIGGAKEGEAALWSPTSGMRIRLGTLGEALVERFQMPRSISSARHSLARIFRGIDEVTFAEALSFLRDAGAIRVHQPNELRIPGSRGGMFNSPVLTPSEAFSGTVANILFLGAPYDLGVTNRPGARAAPGWLRRASGALYQYPQSAVSPPGIWDPVSASRRLMGLRMADLGDLTTTVHHRNGEIFDVLEDIVARTVESGIFPVVLGGDHSLSLAVARGAAAAAKEIGVVQFDAHDDLAPSVPPDWRAECHHGNFMSWVLEDARVKRVVQIGIRQRTPEPPYRDDRLFVLPGKSAECLTDAELLALLPDDLNWHVSFDVDVLDPSELRSTGTPLPGGLSRHALSRLMEVVFGQRRVVALDVAELIPDPHSDVDALLVADILLLAISAGADRK